jgi:hypothetical protein
MSSSDWTRQHNDLSKLHDVHENARKLAILYTIEVEVARLIGRWIPTTQISLRSCFSDGLFSKMRSMQAGSRRVSSSFACPNRGCELFAREPVGRSRCSRRRPVRKIFWARSFAP